VIPLTRLLFVRRLSGPSMKERSEELRRDIALLQESAETLRNEARSLIERSQELGREIDKRIMLAPRKSSRDDAA
jgi:hypothetical protein